MSTRRGEGGLVAPSHSSPDPLAPPVVGRDVARAGRPEATETARQAIRGHLSRDARTARELSSLVGLPEKDVVAHLEHLDRSLRAAGVRLVVEPARCLACGFTFRDRRRLSKPSACPRCRATHVSAPLFAVGATAGPVDRAAVRREWTTRGFSCGLWTDPPGQRWENFAHEMDEVVMLLSGEIEVEVGGRTVRPAIGEEILIPARTRHSVRNTADRTARWLYGYRS